MSKPLRIPSQRGHELDQKGTENKHRLRVLSIKKNKNSSIRQAAAVLFIKKDYENITMDEIASSAQVSKATLYKHFNTKETLYLETIKDLFEQLEQERPSPSLDFKTYLEQHINSCLKVKNIDLLRHCASQIIRFPSLSQYIWDQNRPVYKDVAHYIRQLPEDCIIDDANFAAQQFLSSLYNLLVYPVWYGYHLSPSEAMIRESIEKMLNKFIPKVAEQGLLSAMSERALYF